MEITEADEEAIRTALAKAFEHVEALERLYGMPRVDVVVETFPPREDT